MNTQYNQIPNGIYYINPEIQPNQLLDAISACLCKAEALAITAATTDFESYPTKIINNYMWTLSDLISEAKLLYTKYQHCM